MRETLHDRGLYSILPQIAGSDAGSEGVDEYRGGMPIGKYYIGNVARPAVLASAVWRAGTATVAGEGCL
jgi:hypothetical protein